MPPEISSAATVLPSLTGRKKRGEGHTRRDEILSAAKDLFLSEGYAATTIRRIADRVGVSAPALYLYFPDKDSILLELCDRTFDKLLEAWADIDGLSIPARDKIERTGEAYIRFGLAHPGEYRLIFMDTQAPAPVRYTGHRTDISDPSRPGTKGAVAFAKLVGLFLQLEAEGGVLPYSAVTCAELCWMSVHGLVAALIAEPDFPWSDRETLIRGMVRLSIERLSPDDPAKR